jgi:hypothetical protein
MIEAVSKHHRRRSGYRRIQEELADRMPTSHQPQSANLNLHKNFDTL